MIRLGLERDDVVTDADTIAILELVRFGDARTVDGDAVVRLEIFDAIAGVGLHQSRVLTRHVALGQANRVPILSADRDEVADEGNDDGFPFVVRDDELVHRSRRSDSPLGGLNSNNDGTEQGWGVNVQRHTASF